MDSMIPVADEHESGAQQKIHPGLRWGGAFAVTMLGAGALLLLTTRGEAILIDFYAAAAQMLCF